MSSMKMFVVVVGCVLVSQAGCQTTLPKPSILCEAFSTCDSCIKNTKCLWCMTNSTCTDYPASYILPPPAVCKLSQARWGVCWVNFEALIIAMAVVGGTILISIVVCCCWCWCCCCKRQQGPDRDEERFARRREEIRQRSDERKVERKAKHDDIRKKYGLTGLITDSDHPYRKFENE